MIMFWGFRVVVTLGNSIGNDMGFPIENLQAEIVILFIDVALIVLVIKRKIIGPIGFLLVNLWCFGPKLISSMTTFATGEPTLSTATAAFESVIAIVLALAILLEMAFDKSKMGTPKDKKTDWFYKNEQYDRQLDERADKNNYRTL